MPTPKSHDQLFLSAVFQELQQHPGASKKPINNWRTSKGAMLPNHPGSKGTKLHASSQSIQSGDLLGGVSTTVHNPHWLHRRAAATSRLKQDRWHSCPSVVVFFVFLSLSLLPLCERECRASPVLWMAPISWMDGWIPKTKKNLKGIYKNSAVGRFSNFQSEQCFRYFCVFMCCEQKQHMNAVENRWILRTATQHPYNHTKRDPQMYAFIATKLWDWCPEKWGTWTLLYKNRLPERTANHTEY